ncbi:MBL fold metallo-hydrolase [Rhizobiales bacterium]|uniref:MBL fold metallo-hydrolase n=1 Tax=Hongsoonwoonella zoysiae TaxID=2821844 RepID=UPI00155FCC35|nr:MBL fold metallo-hydrolase [Hongsoonwoonella zoysiae]NRG19824.1 MBL fold metallo-hydrolase [Hongsoonwoonella zoysiae]
MLRLLALFFRRAIAAFVLLPALVIPASAVCQLVAETPWNRLPVVKAALAPDEVRITYLGHSTFEIETPKGIRIATDYSGAYKPVRFPHVVTMNGAHGTHFTFNPDPEIEHVLLGWNPEGGPMDHDKTIEDVRIRNIQTNTRGWDGETNLLGNSIFVFEVADLCIAHLGHLHQRLTENDLTRLGQIDIVFVPVDGSATLSHQSMIEVLKSIGPRMVIPMHVFRYGSLQSFAARMTEAGYIVNMSDNATYIASRAGLPAAPTFLVLPGY